MGAQEQKIATLSSTQDQIENMGECHDWSGFLAIGKMKARRSAEITHVLLNVSKRNRTVWGYQTYMRPTQKTAYSSCFWRFGISRLLITPIGRRAVTKSLTMLMAEFAYLVLSDESLSIEANSITYQVSIRGRQRGSWKKSVVVQNTETGIHMIMELNTAQRVQATVIPSMT